MARVPEHNTRLTTESATMVQMFARMASAKLQFAFITVSINVHVIRWVICVKYAAIILMYVVECENKRSF